MFNSMRNRGDRDRIQETLDAYLDNALTPADRTRFEAQMAADPRLRTEMEQLRALRWQMRAMPRRRVPRSFALDPAVYARPKAQPLLQLYPALRGATALSAFLLIFVLALGAFRGQFGGAPDAAVFTSAPAEDTAEIAAIEVTREVAAEASAAMPADEFLKTAPADQTVVAEGEAAAALAAPPLEGTLAAAPESDLSLEAPAPAATPPNVGGAIEEAAPPPTLAAETTMEPFAIQEAANAPAPETVEQPATLLPLQIGLGMLFLVLLVLWLVARRRAWSL